MTDTIKPAFHAMSFEEIGNWVVKHNVVNGEEIFDEDFAAIEEMYEDGQESEAFDEYETMAHEIWLAMSVNAATEGFKTEQGKNSTTYACNGQGGDMNLFAFGKNNAYIVEYLLAYGKEEQTTGLCSYLQYSGSLRPYFFRVFVQEAPFKISKEYPVEGAVNPGGQYEEWVDTYKYGYDTADVNTETGMLRRWWAYNLAVAVSNMVLNLSRSSAGFQS